MNRRNNKWKGYSLSEIRRLRTLNIVQCETSKRLIAGNLQLMASEDGLEILSNDIGLFEGFTPKGMLKKMLGALNYIDYGVLVFRLTRKIIEMVNSVKSDKDNDDKE